MDIGLPENRGMHLEECHRPAHPHDFSFHHIRYRAGYQDVADQTAEQLLLLGCGEVPTRSQRGQALAEGLELGAHGGGELRWRRLVRVLVGSGTGVRDPLEGHLPLPLQLAGD